jgi:hypothetical protein
MATRFHSCSFARRPIPGLDVAARAADAEREANGAMLLVGWSRGHFPSFPDSAPSFHPNHRKSDAGDKVNSSKLPGGAPYTRAR